MSRAPQIAVVGQGAGASSALEALAEEVGRALAEAGATVVCGGLGGVMEAVARGAAAAGGEAIAIVPGEEREAANEHATHAVATGAGHARNLAVVASADAVIAIGGGWGTLSEIGLARKLGRAVVTLEGWELSGPGAMAGAPGVQAADSAADAVARALAARR